MAIFKGAAVAIVTPMYQDGSVNYDEFRKLIEFQIEKRYGRDRGMWNDR